MKIFRLLFFLLFYCVFGAQWNYDDYGPSTWPLNYPECGNNNQSPIAIFTETQENCTICQTTPLYFDSWLYLTENVTNKTVVYEIKNKKFSLKLTPINQENPIAKFTNQFFETFSANVNEKYCFDGLHFHWGNDSESGSEHSINNTFYPLELHLVHYSCDYSDLSEAVNAYVNNVNNILTKDRYILAVLGIFFELGEKNAFLDEILTDGIIDKLNENDGHHEMDLNIMDLIPGYEYNEVTEEVNIDKNETLFIGYPGSLTTPPCLEAVRWHVMTNKMTVSQSQLDKFRQLLNKDSPLPHTYITHNYRNIQNNTNQIFSCQKQIDNLQVSKDSESSEEFRVYANDDPNFKEINVMLVSTIAVMSIILLLVLFKVVHAFFIRDKMLELPTETETKDEF